MKTLKMQANIIFSQHVALELRKIVVKYSPNQLYLLTDDTVKRQCLPIIQDVIDEFEITVISIPSGEDHKSIHSCVQLWQVLSEGSADRKSLLINVGGGLITDLGGFAASVFKRGIEFVNIPTTLLAQVDASLGGKTGVNFGGLKNELGVFNEPTAVIVDVNFLKTLDSDNLLSGFAEMIKHGLIMKSEHLNALKAFDWNNIDYTHLLALIAESNAIKKWYVEQDFRESGIRKGLNFGHTAGHAFESHALYSGKPILHGQAVIYGMIMELYLSMKCCGFHQDSLMELCCWFVKMYGKYELSEADFSELYRLMTHDKKNERGIINFTLLHEIGSVQINQSCSEELVHEAFTFYQSW